MAHHLTQKDGASITPAPQFTPMSPGRVTT